MGRQCLNGRKVVGQNELKNRFQLKVLVNTAMNFRSLRNRKFLDQSSKLVNV
jgi:hypothetical protein